MIVGALISEEQKTEAELSVVVAFWSDLIRFSAKKCQKVPDFGTFWRKMADDGGEVEIIDCSTDGTCDEDDGGGSESIQIYKSLSEETIDALQQLAIGKKPEKKDTAYLSILIVFHNSSQFSLNVELS